MKYNSKQQALSLIELIIGAAVTSLIITGLMQFYLAGLRSSQRGIEHLNNMGVAAVLMSQIEYDLMRAKRLVSPAQGHSDSSASWEFVVDSAGNTGVISYSLETDGIMRTEKRNGNTQSYVYCRNRKAGLSFDNLVLGSSLVAENRNGVLVSVQVANHQSGGMPAEEFEIIRLITWRARLPRE